MAKNSIEGNIYSAVFNADCKMQLVKVEEKSYCSSSNTDESIEEPFDDNSKDDFNMSRVSSQNWSSSTSNSSFAEQIQNENQSTRKKERNASKWASNKAKLQRNSGKSYISLSKSKKHFEERKMRPPCGSKCRLHCSGKISETDRQKIFDGFWSISDLQGQREFIATRMLPIIPKYRYSSSQGLRKHNNAFHFIVDGINIKVCKTFFKSTLDINDRVIRTVALKKNSEGSVEVDLRGKHKKHRTVNPEIKESVKEFIEAIPRIESHCLQEQTSHEYIEGGRSLADLYRDYKELREQDNLPFANLSMFSRVFNNDFNLEFFKPKKDQCDLGESYKNAGFTKRRFLKQGAVPSIKKGSTAKELLFQERAQRIKKRENKKTVELLLQEHEKSHIEVKDERASPLLLESPAQLEEIKVEITENILYPEENDDQNNIDPLKIELECLRKENENLKTAQKKKDAELKALAEKTEIESKIYEYKLDILRTKLTKATSELRKLEGKIFGILSKDQIAKLSIKRKRRIKT